MVVALPHDEPFARAVVLTGRDLSAGELARAARGLAPVTLAPAAWEAIALSHRELERKRESGVPIYGLTTGFGALDRCGVGADDSAALQLNLLRSHAAGVGDPLPEEQVRALLVARLNTFARGVSGVRPAVAQALLDMLRLRIVPRIPGRGSVGAADLAPLAHAGLLLAGEGRARIAGGVWLPAREALSRAGLEPPGLAGRDAFALVNGLAHSAGTAALAITDAAHLVEAAEAAVAAGMLALDSREDSLEARAIKGHPGARESAARLRELLSGREPPRETAMREALSTRCAHHSLGAVRDAILRAREVVEVELNASVDNPMIDLDGWHTNNAAEFCGQHLAESLDGLCTSITALAAASERRISRLLDRGHNRGLPPFLIHPEVAPGLHSGLMIAQYTAAALVAELRTLAPVSAQTIPTCAGTEDFVSMSALAARRATHAVSLARTVTAIELLCAFQALDLRDHPPTPSLTRAHRTLRSRVPVQVEDRLLSDDIEAVTNLLRTSALS